MFRHFRRVLATALTATLMAGLMVGIVPTATLAREAADVATINRARMGISESYPTAYDDWENGFMCGNGTMGAIVFGDPLNERVVINHRRFFLAATQERSFNKVSEELLTRIRKACAEGDFKTANDLANQAHGWQDGGEGNKHPGYEITLALPEGGAVSGYRRTCNYSTGEITVRWHDDRGDWERQTFVSRADNVLVQRLQKPSDGTLACTVRLGTEEGMHFPAGMKFTYETTADCLIVRAIYPQPKKTGNAGYEGVTRVVIHGANAAVNAEGNALKIDGADEVLLLTRAERYYSDCTTAFESGEVRAALNALEADYAKLLAAHVAVHGELYDRVSLDLGASNEERALTNEQLLAAQKSSGRLNPALYERLFDAGRFYYLCSAGDIGMPDLLGIWTGDCDVGWSGYYHLDANLNLQMSGAVIGNMTETLTGYWYLMDHWADGFRQNASDLLGCRGMLGGGNTPGETSGLISALNYYYPYQYVTGEMAWLLYPYWEYYQATGDEAFLRDRLYPYLREMGLFYEDFLKERDEDGNYIFAGSISPENQPAGLGMSLVNNSAFDVASCEWLLTRLIELSDRFGYEQGDGEGVARWREILAHLPGYRINANGALAEWNWPTLKDNYNHRHSSGLIGVWPYRTITPEADADIFAAACKTLSKKDAYNYENAGHGLLHAALIAANLKNADSVTQKLLRFGKEDFYYSGLTSSHYVNHGVFCTDVCNTVPTVMMEMLVGSDGDGVELLQALPASLEQGTITGMLTRCGVTLNALSWNVNEGAVTATLTSPSDKTVTLTQRQGILAVDTDASVSDWQSGDTSLKLALQAGKPTTVTLHLPKQERPELLSQGAEVTVSGTASEAEDRSAGLCVDGDYSTRWASNNGESAWLRMDLGRLCDLQKVKLFWEAAYAEKYTIRYSVDGENWKALYTQANGAGGTEELDVSCTARYLMFWFKQRTTINGQKYGYSLYEIEVYGRETPSEPEPPIAWGDVNGDGAVDTADAVFVLQRAAKLIDDSGLDAKAADVNRDGAIDTADAVLILQKAAKLIDTFG